MVKSRKTKQSSNSPRLALIYVHFPREPERIIGLPSALQDLIGEEGAVRGWRERADGKADVRGRGWGYGVHVVEEAGLDGCVGRLAAALPDLVRQYGAPQGPWLEVVVDGPGRARQVLRRIDLGPGSGGSSVVPSRR